MLSSVLLFWWTVTTTTTVHAGDGSIYAYMDTRNVAGTETKTHVFALTNFGTLAERITSQIDQWRTELPRNNAGTATAARNKNARLKYSKTLEFTSAANRRRKVLRLHQLLLEFNMRATQYFTRQGQAVRQDHLFVVKERFGPRHYDDDDDNNIDSDKPPSQTELNALHEQADRFRGVNRAAHQVSTVWGDWAELFRKEQDYCYPSLYDNYQNDQQGNNLAKHVGIRQCFEETMSARDQNHRMFDLLEHIDKHLHQIQALGPWQVANHFTFNALQLDQTYGTEPAAPLLAPDDYNPDRWNYNLEMGGLYVGYTRSGKNLLQVMHDNDMTVLEHDKYSNKQHLIEFQQEFKSQMYVVWTLGNETNQAKKDRFYNWWQENDITGKFGYQFGVHEQPNGFLRLGRQVCVPASDCDRTWLELMEEFARTPVVEDLRFSYHRPYGNSRDDLRWLYPGDEVILEQQRDSSSSSSSRKKLRSDVGSSSSSQKEPQQRNYEPRPKSNATHYFAYMDTSNADGTKQRTHVFALTTKGSLAQRVTSQIDQWRRLPDGSSSSSSGEALKKYSGTLQFSSELERQRKVIELYNSLTEFNDKSSDFLQQQRKDTSSGQFAIRELFGPFYPENNLNLPTQVELNSLHDQCNLFRGVDEAGSVSRVFGDWTRLAAGDRLARQMLDLLEQIDGLIHAVEALGFWQVQNRFNFNTIQLPNVKATQKLLHEDIAPDRWHLALEMGGLYMGYSRDAKNILNVLVRCDICVLFVFLVLESFFAVKNSHSLATRTCVCGNSTTMTLGPFTARMAFSFNRSSSLKCTWSGHWATKRSSKNATSFGIGGTAMKSRNGTDTAGASGKNPMAFCA